MTGWLLRRTLDAVVTTLLAMVLLIVLVHYLPGDPLAILFQERGGDPATRAAFESLLGLHRPLFASIVAFFAHLLHGDLGVALSQDQRPVVTLLRERLPATLLLGALTLLIDFTIGLALGVWSAMHPRSLRTRMIGAIAIIGYALPAFVVATLLMWLFAIKLAWLPLNGTSDIYLAADASWHAVLLDHARHLVLPLLTMVLATIAVPLRQQQAAALQTVTQPWVLAARARGVSPYRVAWQHCWRPALTPVVTLLGLWLPMIVTGAVLVEFVFDWPGMGSLIANATLNHDLPLVEGAGLILVAMVQLGSLLGDVLYRVVQPVRVSP